MSRTKRVSEGVNREACRWLLQTRPPLLSNRLTEL